MERGTLIIGQRTFQNDTKAGTRHFQVSGLRDDDGATVTIMVSLWDSEADAEETVADLLPEVRKSLLKLIEENG
jgi:hypothetical protein